MVPIAGMKSAKNLTKWNHLKLDFTGSLRSTLFSGFSIKFVAAKIQELSRLNCRKRVETKGMKRSLPTRTNLQILSSEVLEFLRAIFSKNFK